MLATARDYKRRAKELERAGTRLQRDRDKAIRKAVKGGMPVADVGDAFGLSQQRGRCRPRDALRRGNPRDGPRRLESGAPLVAHELSVGVDAGDYPEEDSHLDGTGVQQNFIIDAFKVLVGVAVDDDHLYWARQDAHAIARSNLAGTGVEENFIDIDAGDENVHYPQGVAVDAGHVYWAADGNGSRVGRANLDGTGVDQHFIDVTCQASTGCPATAGEPRGWRSTAASSHDSLEGRGRLTRALPWLHGSAFSRTAPGVCKHHCLAPLPQIHAESGPQLLHCFDSDRGEGDDDGDDDQDERKRWPRGGERVEIWDTGGASVDRRAHRTRQGGAR
jgi:hypothetical protein